MKKLLTLLLLVVLAAGVTVGVAYTRIHQAYRGYTGSEQFVDIPPGAGSRAIGERLVQVGVVRDAVTYRATLWLTGQGRHLKAGEYRFERPMTPIEVVDKIARGEVYVINVTFPEGLTIAEMSKIFESYGFGPASAFVDATKEVSLIRDLDPVADDLEGYLFPETYPLSRHTDAPKLVRLMVARFEHVFGPTLRQAAAARNLTPHQAVTLAAIVEKETARPDERPLVSAVYENRLRIGMALQCDPTVIYALQRAGRYDGKLRKDDLQFDSPYNTYRYPGLPPGPIASPGQASLEAAIHPSDSDFLYFVSRNDGSHVFARTLDEHNLNVQKYQVQYFRGQEGRGRAGEAGRAGQAGQAGKAGQAGRAGRAGRSRARKR